MDSANNTENADVESALNPIHPSSDSEYRRSVRQRVRRLNTLLLQRSAFELEYNELMATRRRNQSEHVQNNPVNMGRGLDELRRVHHERDADQVADERALLSQTERARAQLHELFERLRHMQELLDTRDTETEDLQQAQIEAISISSKYKENRKQNNDDEVSDCRICFVEYEDDDNVRRLRCMHYFHQDCIDKWVKINARCAICRLHVIRKENDGADNVPCVEEE